MISVGAGPSRAAGSPDLRQFDRKKNRSSQPARTGSDGIYDRVQYLYNRQGERTGVKDQNGTVHAYDYDEFGRMLHDRGSGSSDHPKPLSSQIRFVSPELQLFERLA